MELLSIGQCQCCRQVASKVGGGTKAGLHQEQWGVLSAACLQGAGCVALKAGRTGRWACWA